MILCSVLSKRPSEFPSDLWGLLRPDGAVSSGFIRLLVHANSQIQPTLYHGCGRGVNGQM